MILRTSWLLRPRKYCRTGQGKGINFRGIKNAAREYARIHGSQGRKNPGCKIKGTLSARDKNAQVVTPHTQKSKADTVQTVKKTPMVDSSKVKMPSALKTRRMTFGASRRVIPQSGG